MPASDCFLISVLLSAYNAEKFLSEALESILAQKFSNFELLVADDGSTDQTRAIINKFAARDERIKCFYNEKNIGKTATINSLFKHAKGSLVTIHDADDVSSPLRFERQVKEFISDDQLGVCGVSFITINDCGFILEYNPMPSSWADIQREIRNRSQFHGPTMMMRRSVLEGLGEIYRPYFRDNYEDTDLAFRILDSYKGINLKDYLYYYRILPSSLCRKNVDVRNRNLYKAVAFLGKQRSVSGSDFLMENKPEKVDEYLHEVTKAYRDDPSLICREAAAYYFHWSLTNQALESAWKGILMRPLDLRNFRTLLYILRKLLMNKIENPKTHYKKVVLQTISASL